MDNFFGWTKSSANSLHSGKLTFSSGKATISIYCHSNLLGEHWKIHNFDGILLGNMVIFHAWLVYRSVASLFIYDPQIYGLLVRNPCRFLFFFAALLEVISNQFWLLECHVFRVDKNEFRRTMNWSKLIQIPDGPYPAIVKANMYSCWSKYRQ